MPECQGHIGDYFPGCIGLLAEDFSKIGYDQRRLMKIRRRPVRCRSIQAHTARSKCVAPLRLLGRLDVLGVLHGLLGK